MPNIYTYEAQDLDLKESIKLKIPCRQLDTIVLQFNIYDYDIPVDLTNFNIEFRAIKPDGTLYSQTEDINKVGNLLTINCNNQLTSENGKTISSLRIFDNLGNQKSSYFIVLTISGLVTDEDRIISRTLIDSLEHLDNSINRAIQINQNFDNDIDIANASDILLTETTNTANLSKIALDSSISTANTTKLALDTSNTNANSTKTALDLSKTNADISKSAIDTSKMNADTSKVALDISIDEANAFVDSHGDVSALAVRVTSNENKIGDLNGLTTTDKTNLVNAINELVTQSSDIAYNVKKFGAKGDGITDDTLAIQSALDYCSNNGGGKVLFPAGTYIITDTLVWDVATTSIVGNNATIKANINDITKYAIQTKCTTALPFDNAKTSLSGISFKGNGTLTLASGTYSINSNATCNGILFAQYGTDIGCSHISIQNCTLSGFNNGVVFGTNSYLVKFISVDIFNSTNSCIYITDDSSNYGENISFTNCVFYNSMCIVTEESALGWNHNLNFVNCSFDYSNVTVKIVSSNMSCVNCHFEFFYLCTDIQFQLSAIGLKGAKLNIVNGEIITTNNTGSSASYIFTLSGTSCLNITGTYMNSITTTTGYLCHKADELGVITTTNIGKDIPDNLNMYLSNGENENLMPDGGFEASSIISNISLSGDGVAITDRYIGSNLTLTQDTSIYNSGAKSLKCTKLKAVGLAGAFIMLVPINPYDFKSIKHKFKIKNNGATGTVYMNTGFANLTYDGNGIPKVPSVSRQTQGTVTLTLDNYTNWTEITDYLHIVPKSYNNFMYLNFDISQMSAGAFNIDDIYISKGI